MDCIWTKNEKCLDNEDKNLTIPELPKHQYGLDVNTQMPSDFQSISSHISPYQMATNILIPLGLNDSWPFSLPKYPDHPMPPDSQQHPVTSDPQCVQVSQITNSLRCLSAPGSTRSPTVLHSGFLVSTNGPYLPAPIMF